MAERRNAKDTSRNLICRRYLLGGAVALPWAAGLARRSDAASDYKDTVDGFSITVPEGWIQGEGSLEGNSSFSGATGSRRVVAWYPEGAAEVNISVVITNVGADFTSMGSFGSPYEFGSNLVNSMDRSYLLRPSTAPSWGRKRVVDQGPVQVARLLDAKEASKMYYVEYTVDKREAASTGEVVISDSSPQRHLFSVSGIGFNGTYNRLFTVNAQCLNGDLDEYRGVLRAAISSFRLPRMA